MAAQSTTKLLKKKIWTGKDLGRAYLAHEAIRHKANIDGIPDNEQPMEFFKLVLGDITLKQKAFDVFNDTEKSKEFDEYQHINNWIELNHSKALVHHFVTTGIYGNFHEFISVWALQEMNHMEFDMAHNSFFTGENYNESNSIEDLNILTKRYINSHYYVDRFNKIMELIASIYRIPEIINYQIDMTWQDKVMDSIYTFHLPRLIDIIKNSDNRDRTYKDNSLKILEDIFDPIKKSSFIIPEKKVAEAKRFIKKENQWFYGSDLMDILFYIPD